MISTRRNYGYTRTHNSRIYNQRGQSGEGIINLNPVGQGIMDVIRTFIQKAPEYASKAADAYSGEVGTMVKNMIPSSDENGRSAYPGEKHAMLQLANGKYGIGNYIGPGTEVVKRIRRGDPPRTLSDKVAEGHDIRYTLANNLDDIRRADTVMVNKLKQIERDGSDSRFNTTIGKRLIQAKMAGEDAGVLDRNKFAQLGQNPTLTQSDKGLLQSKLSQLEQEGYGLGLPGMGLKQKLLRKQGKGKHCGSGIFDSILGTILPVITQTLGLPNISGIVKTLTGSGINPVGAGKALKSPNTPSGLAKAMANHILPALIKAKMKQLPKSQRGTGMKRVSKSYPKLNKLLSHSLMKVFKAASFNPKGKGMNQSAFDNHKNTWSSKITSGLMSFLGPAIKALFKTGNHSGRGMKGAGFFDDFKKGFMSVMSPALKFLGPVASIIAPEFAPIIAGANAIFG